MNQEKESTFDELLNAALSYAKRGWLVFPLYAISNGVCECGKISCASPAKHPRTPHGLKDATGDESLIRLWWQTWSSANIGIKTGMDSGLFVLDVDPRHGGDETLAELEAKHSKLPNTIESITGGRGRHIFFKHPGEYIKSTAGVLGPGLDVRGDGGYIVAPPSQHVTRNYYEWEISSHPDDTQLAETPTWLLELLLKQKKDQSTNIDTSVIPEGRRNEILTSLAGTMRYRGMSEPAILAALQQENKRKCSPPLSEDEVKTIAKSVSRYEPENVNKPEKIPQTQILGSLSKNLTLFHTPEGDAYVSFQVNNHLETYPVRSKTFRGWLQHEFFLKEQKPPSSQALQDILDVLEAKARFEGNERQVFTRLGKVSGIVYLDLANSEWEVLEITANGWRIIQDSPIKFRRSRGMLALPHPVSGGSIEELRPFVNIADDKSWNLLVSWLIGSLKPDGPFPILCLQGEQDSAKSTTSRFLRSLVDPSNASLRTLPRDERDLQITAKNSWILCLDNLSGLTNWLSDAFCRLATGGGFSTRELFSDAEEIILDAKRPIILNGISDIATRQDLADRSIHLVLPPISNESRKTETELKQEFEIAQPRILGALCDAVSAALHNYDQIKLVSKPRMADFAVWVTAAESQLPWEKNKFIETYMGNRVEAVRTALEGDPIAIALQELIDKKKEWEGTATQLLEALKEFTTDAISKSKEWPKGPAPLSNRIRRAARGLRTIGIDIETSQTTGSKSQKLITIRKIYENSDAQDANDANQKEKIDIASMLTTHASQAKEFASTDMTQTGLALSNCVDRVTRVDRSPQNSNHIIESCFKILDAKEVE